nr:hypothetical protein [Halobacillus karajensis]
MITLVCGTAQLNFVLDLGWSHALSDGVYSFITVGLIKAFLASWIGIIIRKQLIKARDMKEKTSSAL